MLGKHEQHYNNLVADFAPIADAKTENNFNRKEYFKFFDFSLRGKELLDMACGEGTDLLYYQKKGAAVHGFDASAKLLALARKKVLTADLKIGFLEKIPFAADSFDLAVSKYAMQIAKKIDPIYKEVDRVLKKDGLFIFLVTHPIRAFMEKRKNHKDYFKQEIVESIFFSTKVVEKMPTHTMQEYLSDYFLSHFEIISFIEKQEPVAQPVNHDIYPGFMIIKARKK